MRKTNSILDFLWVLWGVLFLSGCSTEEEAPMLPQDNTVPVRFEIGNENLTLLKAPGDASLSVNRILILPFVKTNESLSNDPANFTPVYVAAKQMDVNSFPVISTKLNLSASSTYTVMVLGYNRNDYDFSNQSNPSRRFSIGAATAPATLGNFSVTPVNIQSVPELFSCLCNGYQKGTSLGTYFKPGNVTYIQGNLQRIVSGITLEVTGIPGYVSSLSLASQQLMTSAKATDGTPLSWQTTTSGTTATNVMGKQIPSSGKVTFNQYLLPTMDVRKTLLYLDVSFGTSTQRYTVKVPDTQGVSVSNQITFAPNHWVKIAGSYANINLGFTILCNVNLDDDSWDGIQSNPGN